MYLPITDIQQKQDYKKNLIMSVLGYFNTSMLVSQYGKSVK